MKLREQFEAAGLDTQTAQMAMICTMNWMAEMASTANRSRHPEAAVMLEELQREELPISPPRRDVITSFADVEPHVQEKRPSRPPRAAPLTF